MLLLIKANGCSNWLPLESHNTNIAGVVAKIAAGVEAGCICST